MSDAIGKTFGSVIEERLTNPLVSSIAIAWVGWNYKFFVVLFSDNGVREKLALMRTVAYPEDDSILKWGILAPVGSALLYLAVVPFLTLGYYKLLKYVQKPLLTAKYDATEALERLSEEDSQKLWARLRDKQKELDEFGAKLEMEREAHGKTRNQSAERQTELESIRAEVSAERAEALRIKAEFVKLQGKLDAANVSNDDSVVTVSEVDKLTEAARDALMTLMVHSADGLVTDDLFRRLRERHSEERTRRGLSALIDRKYIIVDESGNGQRMMLTMRGVRAARLTRAYSDGPRPHADNEDQPPGTPGHP